MRKYTVAIFCLAGTMLSSCDTVERAMADPEPSIADAGQLVEPNPFDELMDLATILDPKGVARDNYENEYQRENGKAWKDLPKGQQTDFALRAFYDLSAYPGNLKLRRNRVQERLLVESNRRCNLFKSLVYQIRSKSNFLLGALGTITGVAGGMVTGVGGSRILSGTSGIFSGLRAEFNQELFQNLATQVIVQGVDTRRREVYDAIATRGQAKSIDVYPVEAAIKDAIFYHGQCSVIVGFQMARDAIKTVEDPGIEAANRTLAKLTVTRKLLNIGTLTPKEAVALLAETNAGLTLAGTPLGNQEDDLMPVQALVDARVKIQEIDKSIRKFIEGLADLSKERKGTLTGITQALDKANKAALKTLAACNDDANTKSDAIIVANRELDQATEEDAILDKTSARDEVLLRARALIKIINKVPDLFALYVTAARQTLQKGVIEKKLAAATDAAKATLIKVDGIKACSASKAKPS